LLITPRTFPAVVSTTADIDEYSLAAVAAGAVNGGSAAAAPHNEDLRIARRLTVDDRSAMSALLRSTGGRYQMNLSRTMAQLGCVAPSLLN